MAQNFNLRNEIINYDTSGNSPNNENIINNLKRFIENRLNTKYFSYDIRICEPNNVCGISDYPLGANIYTSERLITSSPEDDRYIIRKVKLFIWANNQ